METTITSASNPTIKQLRKLKTSAKYRRSENLYLAEGIHLVDSYLAANLEPHMVVYAVSALQNAEVSGLIVGARQTGAPLVAVADSLFESLTSVHASVGILVVFRPSQPVADAARDASSVVLLDDVQDPGNIGTVLRTAAAVGVGSIYLSTDSASPWSPKALRAGMGAQFGLIIHEDADLVAVIKRLGLPSYATSLVATSSSLYDLDISTSPVAWIFGNEGQGVSQAVAQKATQTVYIPQSGQVESLNISAAVAVCLYEEYRQKL